MRNPAQFPAFSRLLHCQRLQTVLVEENGDQIRAFLAREPGFALVPPGEVANALGERAYLFRHAVLTSDEGLLMTPRRTDTDGFYVSVMART